MLKAYALTKLSIIYFLRRLFVVQKKGPFDWITNALVVVVSLWLIALLVFFTVAYSTNSRDDRGTASRTFLVTLNGEIGMAASDSLLDIVIFILPFPMVGSRSSNCFLDSLNASVPDLEVAHVHGKKGRSVGHISDRRMVGISQESDIRSVVAENSNSALGASLVRLVVYADILRNRGNKAMNDNSMWDSSCNEIVSISSE